MAVGLWFHRRSGYAQIPFCAVNQPQGEKLYQLVGRLGTVAAFLSDKPSESEGGADQGEADSSGKGIEALAELLQLDPSATM